MSKYGFFRLIFVVGVITTLVCLAFYVDAWNFERTANTITTVFNVSYVYPRVHEWAIQGLVSFTILSIGAVGMVLSKES